MKVDNEVEFNRLLQKKVHLMVTGYDWRYEIQTDQ